jgi:hypothetical protein
MTPEELLELLAAQPSGGGDPYEVPQEADD